MSGIGPTDDLLQLGIAVVQDLPGVGKNLNDRLFLELTTVQQLGSHHRSSYVDSPEKLEDARAEWTKNQTGPLADYYMPQVIGYFQSAQVLASEEFEQLDPTTQKALRMKTKPSFEIISVSPTFEPEHKATPSFIQLLKSPSPAAISMNLSLASTNPSANWLRVTAKSQFQRKSSREIFIYRSGISRNANLRGSEASNSKPQRPTYYQSKVPLTPIRSTRSHRIRA